MLQNKWGALLIVIVLLTSGCMSMGPGYYVQTAPTMTLPNGSEVPGQRVVAPGQTITSAPIGYGAAARLLSGTTISVLDRSYVLTGDDILPLARLNSEVFRQLSAGSVVFCGDTQIDANQGLASMATLGLSNLFKQSGPVYKLCLVDAERDNIAESVLLIGANSAKNLTPFPITPVGYSIEMLVPMGAQSELRVVYLGTNKSARKSLQFEIQLFEKDKQQKFVNMRHQIKLDSLPQDISLAGAKLRVLTYDGSTGSVTIDVQNAIPAAAYELRSVY